MNHEIIIKHIFEIIIKIMKIIEETRKLMKFIINSNNHSFSLRVKNNENEK
jgi:hypothetical protein